MKRIIPVLLALPFLAPAPGLAEIQGELSVGARGTDFADDSSAKFDEYRDMSDGLFGGLDMLVDSDTYILGVSFENPTLDDQSYEVSGNLLGVAKGEIFYDELTHQLYRNTLSPVIGTGGNFLVIPDADNPASRAPLSSWNSLDYSLESKTFGAQATVDPQTPFYFKPSVEHQRKEGIMPWGTIINSDFEVPMPIDYETSNAMLEAGYRGKGTTAVMTAGYSQFDNDNDLLTTFDGVELEEYSTPADNHSYNFSGRLTQRLSAMNLLAVKASYNRNLSEADFSRYLRIVSPSADNEFDGDVSYLRGSAILTTQWDRLLATRLFYRYVNRDNESEEITTITGGTRTNHPYEYDKHQAGVDADYRLSKVNKLSGGYELTFTDQTREDADESLDNLVFAELKNTSMEWVTTKLRLEYLNRSSDSDYSEETLTGDGIIHEFYTPFDYASKDRYKAKLAFDLVPAENLELGLSYGLAYDDYDATMLGLQEDLRHEVYIDASMLLQPKIRLNTYAGYEYTNSDFDSRRYDPGNGYPLVAPFASNYNWNEEFTYDFFAVGGSISIPAMARLELVLNVDYQLVDGNIDFVRAATAGAPLETITNADDYYKTQAGIKCIYKTTDQLSMTLGYAYERSNLDEWKYDNYTYTAGSIYLSGAGTDSDYEAHQVYIMTSYRF